MEKEPFKNHVFKYDLLPEMFRSLIDHSHFPVQFTDIQGKFIYVNAAWCRALGYSFEEIPTLDLFDILHPNLHKHFRQIISNPQNRKDTEKIGFVFVKKTGEWTLLEGYIYFELLNDDLAIQVILQSKTKERLIFNHAKWNEKEFKFIVESANDIIGKTDVQGNIIYVNEVTANITGYPIEKLIGMNYIELVAEDERETVMLHYQNHFKNKSESSFFEFRIQKMNGEIVWVEQNLQTIFRDKTNKHIDGYQIVARDITERKLKEEELQNANKLILNKNKELTSSINYAQVIQNAILPQIDILKEVFPESFIIYKPRDIVSGDFYWFGESGDNLVFAIGDCTGHGVPGALMTMVGINEINNIVYEKGIVMPGEILTMLDESIIKAFNYSLANNKIRDGMDIAICTYNKVTGKLFYGGARRPLCFFSDGVYQTISPVKKSIGEIFLDFELKYTTEIVSFANNSSFYLYSDGYVDQFGGSRERKFTKRKLDELLLEIAHLPMKDQGIMIDNAMVDWMADNRQVDDIIFLGFKINTD